MEIANGDAPVRLAQMADYAFGFNPPYERWFAPTRKVACPRRRSSKPSLRKSDGWWAGNWASAHRQGEQSAVALLAQR